MEHHPSLASFVQCEERSPHERHRTGIYFAVWCPGLTPADILGDELAMESAS